MGVGLDTTLRTLPFPNADAAGEHWLLKLALQADGRLRGTAEWRLRGDFATAQRQTMEAEAGRREALQSALAARFPGVAADALEVEGLRPADDPFVARATIEMPPLQRAGDAWRLPRAGQPWRLVDAFAHAAERRRPLTPGPPRTVSFRLEIARPAGARGSLPPDVHLPSDFGEFHAVATESAGAWVLETTWRLTATRIAPEAYPAFRAWLTAIDRALDASAQVSTRRGGP